MKRKTCEDDFDIEFQEDSISHGKRQRRGTTSQANENSLEGALATWGRGDDDLEPSTKMLRMLELLKEWHSAGDKTIIYSQCMMSFWCNASLVDLIFRDIDAWSDREGLLALWHQEPTFWRFDGPSCQRSYFGHFQTIWRAKGHIDKVNFGHYLCFILFKVEIALNAGASVSILSRQIA